MTQARCLWRWLSMAALPLAVACADESGAEAPQLPSTPPPEPVPLPGCEAFDYGRCDVRAPECLDNLVGLASCMRDDSALEVKPGVAVLTQAEAELDLLQALQTTPRPPSPNHFERALVLLGLTQPSSFEPEATAQLLSQTYAAYYRRDRGELVVIDHGGVMGVTGPGSPAVQALVLHELIHALQDREHDLDAFALAHQQDSDGNLRGNCVIEGEARMHELRLYSALWGVDVSAVDWQSELLRRRNEAEDEVFATADLYSSSLLSVPYAFGAAYVERVWAERGIPGVRALFDAPPASVREILAPLWGEAEGAGVQAVLPLAPEGLTREAYSSLGAWNLYLRVRPLSASLESARHLALSWRGDLLEAFSHDAQQTAVSWTIDLASEADAAQLVAVLAPEVQLRVLQSGAQVRILVASGELPPALLAAGGP